MAKVILIELKLIFLNREKKLYLNKIDIALPPSQKLKVIALLEKGKGNREQDLLMSAP
ncbi:MAG: hypothetical protein AAGJ08_12940 [Cyanobacteria bacterium P01_H01_bin.35]